MMKFNDSRSPLSSSSADGRASEGLPSGPSVLEVVRALPGWYLADRRRTLGVKYRFRETPEALAFLAHVTELARQHGASPHLVLTAGGQLHLRLRSHQPGGVGEEELAFAQAVAILHQEDSPAKTLSGAGLHGDSHVV